jgi:hypothetical protein
LNITFEYPAWLIIVCALAGVGYAFALYYRDKATAAFGTWAQRGLFALRTVAVFFISLLLLGLLIKTSGKEVEKPIVVFAQDNSQSIVGGADSAFYRKEYADKLKEFFEKASDKFDLKVLSFGDKVSDSETRTFDYKEKQTDMSGIVDEIQNRYANRNVGAVILASDGIFNRGSSPVYAAEKLNFPFYTIALGDTTVKKDLAIASLNYNRTVFLGNSFPIEVVVDAKKLRGKSSILTVKKGDQTVFTSNVTIPADAYTTTVPILLDAKESGVNRYRIALSVVEGETNVYNNVADIFVNVLDSREKVLILAASPHPDIAALKNAIESNENYEVEVGLGNDFTGSLAGYSLVIMHQLPSNQNMGTRFTDELTAKSLPVLYILGGQTNTIQFNKLGAGVSITGSRIGSVNDVQLSIAPNFSYFTLNDETRKALALFPPLQSPYGTYGITTSASVLGYQQIGTVKTENPLVLFNEVNGRRTGVIAGEGLWRWRLEDYQNNQSHTLFNEFVGKVVQYLSVKEDKSYFRVSGKTIFNENEPIILDAELYNQSYELVNTPDVDLTISNAEGKAFSYRFSKTSNAYRLNAGQLPPGEYKYTARVKLGDKAYSKAGSFSIAAIKVELTNTVADHRLLYTLAQKKGGKMYYPKQLGTLLDDLNKREDIKPVSYTQKRLDDLINLRWIFFILLGLLATEWFIRKRNGAY